MTQVELRVAGLLQSAALEKSVRSPDIRSVRVKPSAQEIWPKLINVFTPHGDTMRKSVVHSPTNLIIDHRRVGEGMVGKIDAAESYLPFSEGNKLVIGIEDAKTAATGIHPQLVLVFVEKKRTRFGFDADPAG